ncbi:MAG: hypothetical protein OXC55_05480 [Chloroflexi bacterium]|nr:hypothetical protein [Chloroflexota bacterium]
MTADSKKPTSARDVIIGLAILAVAFALLALAFAWCVSIVMDAGVEESPEAESAETESQVSWRDVREGCESAVSFKSMIAAVDVELMEVEASNQRHSRNMASTGDPFLTIQTAVIGDAILEFSRTLDMDEMMVMLNSFDDYIARCRELNPNWTP